MIKRIKIIALIFIFTTTCSSGNPSTPVITTSTLISSIPPTTPATIFNDDNSLSLRYSSSSIGISFYIPEEWHVEENEYGITITTDPSLHIEDNLSFAKGEAIILLRIADRVDDQPYDDGTMIDMLNNLPPYLPPGRERAHIIILNGKTIAFAGYGINKPFPYPSFTAMTLLDKKVVLGLIFTSISNERSFRRLFQDMIASIENVDVP